jgi:hypothetical protein
MIGKLVTRAIRHRWKAAVIWAMVPLAILNAHSVAGCLSSTGHFEPGCRCWESSPDALTGCCHCPCCAGKTVCCCKLKPCGTHSLTGTSQRTPANGWQSEGHCTPMALYAVTPAIKSSIQVSDHSASIDLTVAIIDLPLSYAQTTVEHIAPLDSGPPPNNLVVELHRFLI